MRIRRISKLRGAAAKKLGGGKKLRVNLQTYDNFVFQMRFLFSRLFFDNTVIELCFRRI